MIKSDEFLSIDGLASDLKDVSVPGDKNSYKTQEHINSSLEKKKRLSRPLF